jgi:hypothetical protein
MRAVFPIRHYKDEGFVFSGHYSYYCNMEANMLPFKIGYDIRSVIS